MVNKNNIRRRNFIFILYNGGSVRLNGYLQINYFNKLIKNVKKK